MKIESTEKNPACLGIDIGSTTVKVVLIDQEGHYLSDPLYLPSFGEPIKVLRSGLKKVRKDFNGNVKLCATGSGRDIIVKKLGLGGSSAITEIYAHARGAFFINPKVKTIIDVGGQDTKMIHMSPGEDSGDFIINNFVMNDLCAAGTGAFIELHAKNLGFKSVAKFGEKAVQSACPCRISGRCSILALSDVVHHRQEGEPVENIAAGLCRTIAMNVISLAKGQKLESLVFFQGGVASNKGVAKALKELLGLDDFDFIIPPCHDTIGALGAALHSMNLEMEAVLSLDDIIRGLKKARLVPRVKKKVSLRTLGDSADESRFEFKIFDYKKGSDFVLGIDIGAASVKLVALDMSGRCIFSFYKLHDGQLVRTVNAGLEKLKKAVEGKRPKAVATTGSGRENIGELMGADFKINEITAQGRGAFLIYPKVQTIFEIGGQDSKFIKLRNKQVEDFEMNKVCAAGTGAFIEEVGRIIRGKTKKPFDFFAFKSQSPAYLNHRCSVFAKSDAVALLNEGFSREDVAAGIAYAAAENYLRLVVGNREIGREVLFLGGLAQNCRSAVSAMRNIRQDLNITVPAGGDISGALGAASLALERFSGGEIEHSGFGGFAVKKKKRGNERRSSCSNCPVSDCEKKSGNIVKKGNSKEVRLEPDRSITPLGRNFVGEYLDLIREYERSSHALKNEKSETIGIPRALIYYYQGPLWVSFLESLGLNLSFSEGNGEVIQQGNLKATNSETCLPVKSLIGHVDQLVKRGVRKIFFPVLVEFERQPGTIRCDNCLLIQSAVDSALKTNFPDVEFISPSIRYFGKKYNQREALRRCGEKMGFGRKKIESAIKKAENDFCEFTERKYALGKEFLNAARKGKVSILMMGHAYNSAPEIDMGIPETMARLGANVSPLSILPFFELERLSSEKDKNIILRTSQDFYLGARHILENEPSVFPIIASNFLCRPDSISVPIVKKMINDRPVMHLTIDDASAKSGFETRCAAFYEVAVNYLRKRNKKKNKIVDHPFYYFRPERKWKHVKGTVWLLPTFRFYAAGFNSIGIKTEFLSDGGNELIEAGRKFFPVLEPCLPFIQTSGALEKLIKEGTFNNEKDVFCVPGTRHCASASLSYVFREVADVLDFEMKIISPREGLDITEVSDIFGFKFTLNLLRGLFADEYLKKLHLSIRPYEKKKGEADRVYAECRRELYDSFNRESKKRFYPILEKIIRKMTFISVKKNKKFPKILVTGSYYERSELFLNDDIYRKIEDRGGEVVRTALFTDYLEYILRVRYKNLWKMGKPLSALRDLVSLPVAIFEMGKIKKRFSPYIPYQIEPNPVPYFEKMSELLDGNVDSNIVLQLYQSYWNMERGKIDGMLSIHPFNCCTSAAVEPILRKNFALRIPYLSLSFDGQSATHQDNRLGAFMECIFANFSKKNK